MQASPNRRDRSPGLGPRPGSGYDRAGDGTSSPIGFMAEKLEKLPQATLTRFVAEFLVWADTEQVIRGRALTLTLTP